MKTKWIKMTSILTAAILITVSNLALAQSESEEEDSQIASQPITKTVQTVQAVQAETTSVAEPGKADNSQPPKQTAESAPVQATPSSTKGKLAADGVFPSITHRGDIVDFLKFISVASGKNIIPSQQVKGNVTVNLYDVTYKEALDAVLQANGYAYEEDGNFIRVYTTKELADIKAAKRKTEPRVFRLNYITVDDAITMLTPLLSDDAQTSTSPQTKSTGKTGGAGGSGAASGGSGETWAGNNYLLIVDYPENLQKIGELIKQIDVKPVQVMIEATILVAHLDDNNEMGIDFNVLAGVNFNVLNGNSGEIPAGSTPVHGTDIYSGTSFTSGVSGTGLNIGILKNNVGIFVKALETITDVATLGNPKVITLNRQPGEVRVGRDEGYISSTESTSTASTQTVQMLQTGTILRFQPFAMDDGYIRMELHPEDSAGQVTVKGSFALPEKTTTEVTTNILVKDGNTIVIGGLFRETTSSGRSQVPVAGEIPILGNLFRSTNDQNTKEEVIFLITPHIIKEPLDYEVADEIKDNCDRIMLGAREGMLPTSRERLANFHYQRAREKQAAGDVESALWYADMANYVSPSFLDAIKLRDELRIRKVYEGQTGSIKTFMQDLIEQEK